MMEFENQEYQEPEDPEEPRRSFGGLSPVEIGILVVLVLVICVLAGLVGKSFYDNSMAANSRATAEAQIPQPTLTLAPTATPEVTVLPWPTTEPIPEWNKFEFAAEKASLWLPNSYQGGGHNSIPLFNNS